MNAKNTPRLAKWLADHGYDALSKLSSFEIDPAEGQKNLDEVMQQFPNDKDEWQDRAAYRILTHAKNTPAALQQDTPTAQTAIQMLNDGLRGMAQLTAGLAAKSDAILKPLIELRNSHDEEHAILNRKLDALTSLFVSSEENRKVELRRIKWAVILFAVFCALMLAARVAHAAPPDESRGVHFLNTVRRDFGLPLLPEPQVGGGVLPVNLVYNTSANPLFVSCVGGTCSGGGGGGGTSSTFGAAFPATGTAVGFIDASGNMAGANLDAGGRMITTGAGGTFPVTGTFWQATQPVSLTSTTITGTVSVTQGTSPWVISFTAPQHVILDSGTTAVTQATASSLNATVVGTGTFATQSAITAASGAIASGAVASGAIASGAIASGAIASGACVANCIVDGGLATLGLKADAKSTATDTTAITVMQVLKEISFMVQTPAALPANQSVNEAQINGVTVLMGNGTTGTGSQRVTIASDNTVLPGVGAGATAAVVPANAVYQGGVGGSGNLVGYKNCDTSAVYDTNTNGKTQIVGLVSGKVVYVCGVAISQSTSTTVTASLGSGTGTNCGSTYTAKTPAWVIQGPSSVAPIGVVLPNSQIPWFQTAASEELCLSTTAAVSVQVLLTYAQF